MRGTPPVRKRFARRTGLRAPLVTAVLLALLAPTSAADEWKPKDPRTWSPRPLKQQPSVGGVNRDPAKLPPAPAAAPWVPMAVNWPASAQVEADLAPAPAPLVGLQKSGSPFASSGLQAPAPGRVPGTPVWVAAAQPPASANDQSRTAPQSASLPRSPAPAAAAQPAPGRVRVTVGDRGAAEKAGVAGLVAAVRPIDPAAAKRVKVGVDYTAVRHAFGGDWASRVRLVAMPECALSTPDVPSCRTQTPLASVNDTVAGQVVADVDLSAASGTAPSGATARLAAPSGAVVLAATAAPSGAAGDYTATSLAPSASWTAGSNTGSFTWSYPITVPPALGASPSISLHYDSGSVDGRTPSRNAQPSWIGDGWDYQPGFVERSYKPCSKDGKDQSGELCWGPHQISMSLNGSNSLLVRDDESGQWRSQDGSIASVQLLNGAANGDGGLTGVPPADGTSAPEGDAGEHWKVTTTDGTQYFFGAQFRPGGGTLPSHSAWTVPVYANNAGEPCYDADFAKAYCVQAWRWNLDYVIDVRGSLISYTYSPETNFYARGADATNPNGTRTEYVRGGQLAKITYGGKAAGAAAPTAQVLFTTAERCLTGPSCAPEGLNKDTAIHWPDVPFDQRCASSGVCENYSPTFWTTKRLTTITTQNLVSGTPATVDEWSLVQQFPDPKDQSSPALWLASLSRTGYDGANKITLPSVDFTGQILNNRVDLVTGLALNRHRIQTITSENGAQTNVKFADQQCAGFAQLKPDTNTERCMPVIWTPGDNPPVDWFHKYVVAEVTQKDATGGSPLRSTRYEYVGPAAWHRDDSETTDAKNRTWNNFRGYAQVVTRAGVAPAMITKTATFYLRGMHRDTKTDGSTPGVTVTDWTGATLTDSNALAGTVYQTHTYTGDNNDVTAVQVSTPVQVDPPVPGVSFPIVARHARGGGLPDLTAHMTRVASVKDFAKTTNGTWRSAEQHTIYDTTYGVPLTVSDRATGTQEMCTTTKYGHNLAKQLLALPTEKVSVIGPCGTAAGAGTTVSHMRTLYDGSETLGTIGDFGAVTKTQVVQAYTGQASDIVTTATMAYDDYGRTKSVKDALGNETTTSYTPADGAPATSVETVNPLKWRSTTAYSTSRYVPVKTTDPNGRVTELSYDPLGRSTAVWLPGWDRAAHAGTPSIRFTYAVRKDKPSAVTTETIRQGESYDVSIQLLDSFLAVRQTQQSAPDLSTGRLITDTVYDSLGRPVEVSNPYYNQGTNPSTDFFNANDNEIPGQTGTFYDGMGRVEKTTFSSRAVDQDGKFSGPLTSQWSKVNAYPGADRTNVTPPTGGTAVTTITDTRGKPIQLRQYRDPAKVGSDNPADYSATSYWYDPRGQLEKATDPAGNTWTYGYDLLGRKIRTSDPDAGQIETGYDLLDRVESTKDGRGQVLKTTWDELGRKKALYKDAVGDANMLSSWEYDPVGALGQASGSTRYVGGKAGQQYKTQVTGYDAAYRPLGTTTTLPATEGQLGISYTTKTEYHPVSGLPIKSVLPAVGDLPAEDIRTPRNDSGAMVHMYSNLADYVNLVNYDRYGRAQRVTYGDIPKQVAFTTDFDSATGRVMSTYLDRQTGPGDTLVTDSVDATTYTYKPSGDVTAISNRRDDGQGGLQTDTQCFAYDHLSRLTEAWTDKDGLTTTPAPSVPGVGGCTNTSPTSANIGGPSPYWQSFSYDTLGNRTKLVEHALPGAPGPAGQDATTTYSYPSQGQVGTQPHTLTGSTTSGTSGTTVNTYGYDSGGNTTSRILTAPPSAVEANGRVYEAETLRAYQDTSWQTQADGFGNTFSGGKQLLSYPAGVGQTRTVTFTVPEAGTYRLSSRMSTGTDFATVKAKVDNTALPRVFDGYAPEFRNTDVAWGTSYLAAGEHTLTFTATGKNAASTHWALGMDFLRVTPASGEQVHEAETLTRSGTVPVAKEQGDCCGNSFSGGKQLLAQANGVGQTLNLNFNVPATGEYLLSSLMSVGRDFGTISAKVDNTPLALGQDGYNTEFRNREVTWGAAYLTAGQHTLTLTVTGKHASSTNYVFGMDQLRIVPAPIGLFNAEVAPRGGTAAAATRVQADCCSLTWNGGAQLLSQTDGPDSIGKTVTLDFSVPADGDYAIDAVMTQAPDFGIVKATVDTTVLPNKFDGYRPSGFRNTTANFGKARLTAGKHTLTLTVDGKNPAATKHRFGIDVVRVLPGAESRQDLTWDSEGRLASNTVATNGQAVRSEYLYDADGNRLIRRDPGKTTVYLGADELTLDVASGTITGTRYYPVAGGPTIIRTGGKLTYQATDHHGTGTTTLDAATLAITRRDGKPFGDPRGQTPAPGLWPGDRGFVGGTTDSATGLTHLGAREYDPATGRFISIDPLMDLADSQQMHGYTYANGNPTTKSDPSGLVPLDDCQPFCQGGNTSDHGPRPAGSPAAPSVVVPTVVTPVEPTVLQIKALPPQTENEKLKKILADTYAKPEAKAWVGTGQAYEALIREYATGQKTGNSFHAVDVADLLARYQKLLRDARRNKPGAQLTARDREIIMHESEKLWKALMSPDVDGAVTADLRANPERAKTVRNAVNGVLENPDMAPVTGATFEQADPRKQPRLVTAPRMTGLLNGLGGVAEVLSVVAGVKIIWDTRNWTEQDFVCAMSPRGCRYEVS